MEQLTVAEAPVVLDEHREEHSEEIWGHSFLSGVRAWGEGEHVSFEVFLG